MIRSTGLRLAGLYTASFAAAVLALGTVTLFSTRRALSEQFDRRITGESMALVGEYRSEGWLDLIAAIQERDQTPGTFEYGVTDAEGHPVAGRLAGATAPMGWSIVRLAPDDRADSFKVFAVPLGQGQARLLVGDDLQHVEALDGVVMRGFGFALLGIVVLGVAGGFALSSEIHRRLAAISGTAEAIIDGDLARRVPLRGTNDDLDHLAQTINRMLDRIQGLMESLRQVSNDIAHDLRTPLTRVRQRVEAGLADPREGGAALEAALEDLDSILETFSALLRIAQIESRARRANFQLCNLAEIARTVVEAFAPSAEDERQLLVLTANGSAHVPGDRELLTQMLVNLVENSLRHAGAGAVIRVMVDALDGDVRLRVTDNGPGVPPAERERVFSRFYRLERSRSTPGSGLGLSLVAAVAKLHDAQICLDDARPGLDVQVVFPARRPRPTGAGAEGAMGG